MFRPAAMMRLSVVFLERDERVVLRELGESGAVELTRTKPGPETAPLAPRDRTIELARCDRLLTGVENLRRSLEIRPPTEEQRLPAMTLNQADETLRSMEEQADVPLKRRQHLMQRWSELATVCEHVTRFRGLDVPLDHFDQYSFLHFVTGSLPSENLEALQEEVGDRVALLPLPGQEGRQALIAMTTRQGRAALEDVLQQAGFEHEMLPAVEGATTGSLSLKSEREQEQVSAELESVNAGIRSLAAKFARSLAEIEKLAHLERRLFEAGQNFSRTEAAVLLTGWVPAGEALALEQRLNKTTAGQCVIKITPPENLLDEQIPVLLRQPRLLRPFEMLVSAYGLPNYHELEPTLFVAISYVLMFGMMFGDAGHGAVLAAGGLIALAGRAHRKNARHRPAASCSAVCPASFSGSLTEVSSASQQFKKYALWHDPLEGDPMGLMYGAIGIGVVMISLGLILNIINRFRRGDVIGGLLDKFGVVGLAVLLGSAGVDNQVCGYPVAWSRESGGRFVPGAARRGLGAQGTHRICAASPRRCIRSSRAAAVCSAITESLVGAFEAVLSYLANTISFVRLAAYAMSHAALAGGRFHDGRRGEAFFRRRRTV